MSRPAWRRTTSAAILALCLAAAACGPGVSPIDPAYAAGLFTPDGNDTYALAVIAGGTVKVSAPATNAGAGTRAGFWKTADARSTDQETCATWLETGSLTDQQGAVLRARTLDGRTKAITVTNNVTWGARWGFNIHVMDSGSTDPYHKIGGFLLEDVFRPGGPTSDRAAPLPWRMCARVVGNVVSFIVWPLTDPQPAWDDARYGGSVTLPAGWDISGRPGWYIGHLSPGDHALFQDLTTSVVSPAASSPAGAARAATADGGTATPVATVPPRDPTWIAEAP